MVVQPDNITGPCLFNLPARICLEGYGVRYLYRFANTHLLHFHAFAITAGTDAQESHPVAV